MLHVFASRNANKEPENAEELPYPFNEPELKPEPKAGPLGVKTTCYLGYTKQHPPLKMPSELKDYHRRPSNTFKIA